MGFLSLLSFVERPLSPCILPVCYVAFLPCVNICVYLSKKKKNEVPIFHVPWIGIPFAPNLATTNYFLLL